MRRTVSRHPQRPRVPFSGGMRSELELVTEDPTTPPALGLDQRVARAQAEFADLLDNADFFVSQLDEWDVVARESLTQKPLPSRLSSAASSAPSSPVPVVLKKAVSGPVLPTEPPPVSGTTCGTQLRRGASSGDVGLSTPLPPRRPLEMVKTNGLPPSMGWEQALHDYLRDGQLPVPDEKQPARVVAPETTLDARLRQAESALDILRQKLSQKEAEAANLKLEVRDLKLNASERDQRKKHERDDELRTLRVQLTFKQNEIIEADRAKQRLQEELRRSQLRIDALDGEVKEFMQQMIPEDEFVSPAKCGGAPTLSLGLTTPVLAPPESVGARGSRSSTKRLRAGSPRGRRPLSLVLSQGTNDDLAPSAGERTPPKAARTITFMSPQGTAVGSVRSRRSTEEPDPKHLIPLPLPHPSPSSNLCLIQAILSSCASSLLTLLQRDPTQSGQRAHSLLNRLGFVDAPRSLGSEEHVYHNGDSLADSLMTGFAQVAISGLPATHLLPVLDSCLRRARDRSFETLEFFETVLRILKTVAVCSAECRWALLKEDVRSAQESEDNRVNVVEEDGQSEELDLPDDLEGYVPHPDNSRVFLRAEDVNDHFPPLRVGSSRANIAKPPHAILGQILSVFPNLLREPSILSLAFDILVAIAEEAKEGELEMFVPFLIGREAIQTIRSTPAACKQKFIKLLRICLKSRSVFDGIRCWPKPEENMLDLSSKTLNIRQKGTEKEVFTLRRSVMLMLMAASLYHEDGFDVIHHRKDEGTEVVCARLLLLLRDELERLQDGAEALPDRVSVLEDAFSLLALLLCEEDIRTHLRDFALDFVRVVTTLARQEVPCLVRLATQAQALMDRFFEQTSQLEGANSSAELRPPIMTR